MLVRRPVDAVGSGLLLNLDPLQVGRVRHVLGLGRALVDAAVAERGAVDDQPAHGCHAAQLVRLDGHLGPIFQDWNLLPPASDRHDLVPDDLRGRIALGSRMLSVMFKTVTAKANAQILSESCFLTENTLSRPTNFGIFTVQA